MSGKGSGRRPGEGYASGWDAIFGKKEPKLVCPKCGVDRAKVPCGARYWLDCPMMGAAGSQQEGSENE